MGRISWSKISWSDISWIWNIIGEGDYFWFEFVKIDLWNHNFIFLLSKDDFWNFSIWTIFLWFLPFELYAYLLFRPNSSAKPILYVMVRDGPQMSLTSDIELMKFEFFSNCRIFFLKFSNFCSNVIYLMNQNHHLDLIISDRGFKSLFRKLNIINMIPLLHQICYVGLWTRWLNVLYSNVPPWIKVWVSDIADEICW